MLQKEIFYKILQTLRAFNGIQETERWLSCMGMCETGRNRDTAGERERERGRGREYEYIILAGILGLVTEAS